MKAFGNYHLPLLLPESSYTVLLFLVCTDSFIDSGIFFNRDIGPLAWHNDGYQRE